MNQDSKLTKTGLVYLVGVVIIIVCTIFIAKTFLNNGSTGLLLAKSNDSNATLSISQTGKQAEVIGVGSAKIRLKPGDYLLSSSNNGRQSAKVVSLSLRKTTSATLDPTSVALLPTVEHINFQGLSGLYNNGLSDTQVNLFKYYVFSFKPKTSSVAVKASSIYPVPHNPDTDIGFSLKFNLTINSTGYRAEASYIGTNDFNLKLYDRNSKLVFSSHAN